jgi:ubiquinone/menaquinone biosynthesis C-methylase UbiE
MSGDFTSYGTEEEMSIAHDEILLLVSILKSKLAPWRDTRKSPYALIVPGNHDLDWSAKSHAEKIERYARLSSDLFRTGDVLSAAYDSAELPTYVNYHDFGDECNLFTYLINTTPLGGTNDPRLEGIHTELSEKYLSLIPENPGFTSVVKDIENLMRQDPGYVIQSDLDSMDRILRNVPKRRIKLAVMHHNPSSVPSDNIEAFDTIINAGSLKVALTRNLFDLVLHGHRHILHCSHERYPLAENSVQGIFFLGADSVGCRHNAPFIRIKLLDSVSAHGDRPPATVLYAAEYHHDGYSYKHHVNLANEPIHRPMYGAMRELLKNVGRPKPLSDRGTLLPAINKLAPQIETLRLQLLDWGESSNKWIDEFNSQLAGYSQIFATDVQIRSSTESPQYGRYLRDQYQSRLRSLKGKDQKILKFTSSVYDAILRTGWLPGEPLWGGYSMAPGQVGDDGTLEIARILIRGKPAESDSDRRVLENLDFDHKLFAIPLFVLVTDESANGSDADFVLGVDRQGHVLRCFEFKAPDGRVMEVDEPKRYSLYESFEKMLRAPFLQTVERYLGKGTMISSPIKRQKFAENYDKTRGASRAIVEKLEAYFNTTEKGSGLDIGCGTGNYTFPFLGLFKQIFALDNDAEMLSVAKRKQHSEKIKWIEGNAMSLSESLRSNGNFFDAIWSISTLHYFRREQQQRLFSEFFKLLRPGGLLAVDTEFEEQHRSLWLADYFPSLKKRYEGKIFASSVYKEWLDGIGFVPIEPECFELEENSKDNALRAGQRNPSVYLDDKFLAGIPAFVEMESHERVLGKIHLRRAIEDGSIWKQIEDYSKKSTMPGYIGLILARKPK